MVPCLFVFMTLPGFSALSARQTLPVLRNQLTRVLPPILHKGSFHSRTLSPRHGLQARRSELRYFRLPLGAQINHNS